MSGNGNRNSMLLKPEWLSILFCVVIGELSIKSIDSFIYSQTLVSTCASALCPLVWPGERSASSAALMTGKLRSLADVPLVLDESADVTEPLATSSATLVSVGV